MGRKPISVGIGKFGPYIRYDNKFASIPKDVDPMSVTLEEAQELIQKKIEMDAKKVIHEFADYPDLKVLNGRFGPYISYQKLITRYRPNSMPTTWMRRLA